MNLALANCARRYVTNKTDGPNLFLAHGAFVVLAPLSTERVFHNWCNWFFPGMTKNNPLCISWGCWWSPWLKSVSRRAQRCTENKRPSKRELCSWPQRKSRAHFPWEAGAYISAGTWSYLGRKHTWSSNLFLEGPHCRLDRSIWSFNRGIPRCFARHLNGEWKIPWCVLGWRRSTLRGDRGPWHT